MYQKSRRALRRGWTSTGPVRQATSACATPTRPCALRHRAATSLARGCAEPDSAGQQRTQEADVLIGEALHQLQRTLSTSASALVQLLLFEECHDALLEIAAEHAHAVAVETHHLLQYAVRQQRLVPSASGSAMICNSTERVRSLPSLRAPSPGFEESSCARRQGHVFALLGVVESPIGIFFDPHRNMLLSIGISIKIWSLGARYTDQPQALPRWYTV